MQIQESKLLSSYASAKNCPPDNLPEYAFIGRSNVGKSSLINMLCGRSALAKVSNTPGKTQTINHFLIDNKWYLVDLPGYGYAKVAKTRRVLWEGFIREYLTDRKNLLYIFLLIDSRIPPQKIDLEFARWMGAELLAFAIIYTKTDKCGTNELKKNISEIENAFMEEWEEMPPAFLSSAESRKGKEEILAFIDEWNKQFKKIINE